MGKRLVLTCDICHKDIVDDICVHHFKRTRHIPIFPQWIKSSQVDNFYICHTCLKRISYELGKDRTIDEQKVNDYE